MKQVVIVTGAAQGLGKAFAARWAMNAALACMKQQRFGRIVNLCSLNGINRAALFDWKQQNCILELPLTLDRGENYE